MSREQILSNAKIIMADEVVHGSIVMEGGVITAIDSGNSAVASAEDMQGQYVMPGMVELHTDNLEKYMSPRPSVDWPTLPAMLSHDNHIASAGITTVFDALSIGDISPKSERLENLLPMLEALNYSKEHGLTRIEHRLHLRCEVAHPETLNVFNNCITNKNVGLVSLMDHSPGQRQFQEIEHYRTYYQGKYGLTMAQMQAFEARQIANAQNYSNLHRTAIADFCRQNNVVMASHDDATEAHVQESHDFGMHIAEFPTTEEAAWHSTQKNMKVLMGAPNIVRGGSHSGNIAASTLAQKNLLHILSSDYYPTSLLQAAFILTEDKVGYDLPSAIRTVTRNPAHSVNLTDRGEIAIGKKADVLQVSMHNNNPWVRHVWKQGQRVI